MQNEQMPNPSSSDSWTEIRDDLEIQQTYASSAVDEIVKNLRRSFYKDLSKQIIPTARNQCGKTYFVLFVENICL
jgi:hypothetical protein